MDAISASFLQDTLRPYNPVVPAIWNPYTDLQEGYATANQLDAATRAGQAATLTQENINLLPQTRKFNTSLQDAQARLYGAQADQAEGRAAQARARAAALGQPQPSFVLPASPFDGDAPASGLGDAAMPLPATAPTATADDEDSLLDTSGLDNPMDTLHGLSSGGDSGGFNLKSTGPVSNISAPSADGTFSTTATTFATPADLANYAKTGSLATGDNGKGAWGDNTAGPTPFVALPPSFLRSQGIDPDKARGTPVSVTANGTTVNAVVGDKLPDNSKNGAGIDLNPSLAHSLGIDDVNNFKGGVSFKLGHDDNSLPSTNSPTFAATGTPAATPRTYNDDGLDVDGLLNQNGLVAINNAFPSQTTNDGAGSSSRSTTRAAEGVVTKTPGGIRVPSNDQDVSDLQYKLSQYATQLQTDPRFSSNAAFKQAVKARLGVLQNEVSHAVRTYQNNRAFTARQEAAAERSSASSSRASASAATGLLPDVPGYTPVARHFTGGKLSGDLMTANDLADEAEQQRQKSIDDLNRTIGRAIPGAVADDLMNDRGNFNDATGTRTPGVHYFMQTVIDPQTKERTVQQVPVVEAEFQRLHGRIPPWYYGDGAAAASGPAALTDAIALPISSADDVLNTRPAATPGPPVPTRSKLDTAAAAVAPKDDAEKAAFDLADARQAQYDQAADANKAKAAATVSETQKIGHYMTPRVQSLQAQLAESEQALRRAVQSSKASTGSGYLDAMNVTAAADATAPVKKLRAQLAAASDARNYSQTPDGKWHYNDPFGLDALPDGRIQTTPDGTQTSRRLFQ